MADNEKLIKNLLYCREDIAAALSQCEIIDDVLEGVITSKKKTENGSQYQTNKNAVTINEQVPVSGGPDGYGTQSELKYIPKGKLETNDEYKRRISMTPEFALTPGTLNDRQGALFSEAPEVVYEERRPDGSINETPDQKKKDLLKDFEENATATGESVTACVAKTSELIQRHGFQAIFVNRAPLPYDLDPQKTGKAEVPANVAAEKKLGMPQLVQYTAQQIKDFGKDAQGLAWIKICEYRMERPAWDQKPMSVTIVRVFDRVNITSWKIKEKDGKQEVEKETGEVFPHGYVDEKGQPAIPIMFRASFAGEKEIGRPMLRGCAMADVAATQILSDIRWFSFVHANPILTWTTNSKEFPDVNKNSRYFVLNKGAGDEVPDSMAFIQTEVGGMVYLRELHERMIAEGKAQAGKEENTAITQPVNEQSGISRAWQFKTGQERILFLITHELRIIYSQVMRIVANMLEIDPASVRIEFNEEFDFNDDPLEQKGMLDICDKYDLPTLRVEVLKGMARAVNPDFDEATWKQIEDEIKETENFDPAEHAQSMMPPTAAGEGGLPKPKKDAA